MITPGQMALTRMRSGASSSASVEDAVEVDAEGVVPILLAHVGELRDAQDARAIDQDVELAEFLHQRIDRLSGRGDVAHVGGRGRCGSPEFADAGGSRLGAALIDVERADVAAFLGEAQRDGAADARAGAGHDCGPAFERVHEAGRSLGLL